MNEFVKGHGLGNDYILVHVDSLTFPLDLKAVSLLCDRHFGIGSDGVLSLGSSDIADYSMRIFNPDGSEAEMCGNGARIFSKYLYQSGLVRGKRFRIETKAGIIEPEIIMKEGKITAIRVMMGKASFDSSVIPLNGPPRETVNEEISLNGEKVIFTAVSMGNPHCVISVDDTEKVDLQILGPVIENHPIFPNRTNVQFVTPISRNKLKAIVWERGAGKTLASGTSACAVAAASVKRGIADSPLKVYLPGGELDIEVKDDFAVYMSGPAIEVYRGTLSDEFVELMALG